MEIGFLGLKNVLVLLENWSSGLNSRLICTL